MEVRGRRAQRAAAARLAKRAQTGLVGALTIAAVYRVITSLLRSQAKTARHHFELNNARHLGYASA